MHYLLIYDVNEDYIRKRAEFRNAHLKLAWEAYERGELILGGALQNPSDQAILLFKSNTSEVAENFAKSDPYVKNNLVRKWTVRQWMTVVGDLAAEPIRSV